MSANTLLYIRVNLGTAAEHINYEGYRTELCLLFSDYLFYLFFILDSADLGLGL